MSGNLGANLINQLQSTPAAQPGYWGQQMSNMNALKDYQAKQAVADITQQSIGPDGVVDPAKFNLLMSRSPQAAWAGLPAMQAQGQAQNAQAVASTNQLGFNDAQQTQIAKGLGAMINQPDSAQTPEAYKAQLQQLVANRTIDPSHFAAANAAIDALGPNPDPTTMRMTGTRMLITGLSTADIARTALPQTTVQNIGGQLVPAMTTPGSLGRPPTFTQGGGSITTTASPDTVVGMPDAVVPATADDVKNGLATAPGQPVHISGAERIRRFGITGLLPPGAREIPSTGGVTDSSGNRVSPTNQPRLNVPTPATSTPPAATAPAAPTSPAAPSLPVPPVPPAGGPPAAPMTAAASPTPPPAPASATDPPAVASAKAAAKTTGKPVPIVGGNGLVANPDGSVGPAGGSGFPRPSVNAPRDSMTPGPTSMLQGGVPVASGNALAPNLGAPSAPSPLVPGDVSAIMQGMTNRARGGGGPPGTQQAAGGTFAAGPGYDEQVNATTSQERLAADTKIAANYASNVFPYTQALSALGRGMTTAPGSDFLNAAKGFAGGMARSMGFGGTFDSTKDYDELHKWLSQIVTNNPVAQGSDARLAATLSGNANTGIHELASADMMKAGTALMRMNATASSEWANNPQVRAQYGYYNDFLRDFNKNVDPRAFAWDMYNPEQKKTLLADIDSHDEAYAQKFLSSRNMAQRNGYLGETRAMP